MSELIEPEIMIQALTLLQSYMHLLKISQKCLVLEAFYGNLNLYGNLKKVNFCYLVTWTQPLQAEIQITK